MESLLSHRCGHKLDYAGDGNVVAAHNSRLDYAASVLGDEVKRPEWLDQSQQRQNWTAVTESGAGSHDSLESSHEQSSAG